MIEYIPPTRHAGTAAAQPYPIKAIGLARRALRGLFHWQSVDLIAEVAESWT